MTKERVDDTRFSKVITAENVKKTGEIIAISAMKKVMGFCNNSLDDLYAGLVHDVFDYKPIDEPYSDGYDIACEAIAFLCEHIGDTLDKVVKTDKKGRDISVQWACYRVVFNYIEKQKCHIYFSTSLQSIPKNQEPTVDFDPIEVEDGNDKLDATIERMNLNKGQLETLNCYMAGMGFVEIAELLAVNLATVWRRRQQLQQKYNQLVASAAY